MHQLHSIGRQAAVGQGLLHQPGQGLVGLDRLGAPAQNAGVATLDRQAGSLDGHIGPALEDHAKYANWHPHLAHPYAAGLLAQAGDFANDFWHIGELFAAVGAGLQNLGAELEPVHQRCRQASGGGALQVFGVVGLQRPRVLAQQNCQAPQGLVFGGSSGFGHQGRGGFGLGPQAQAVLRDVERVHASALPYQAAIAPSVRGSVPPHSTPWALRQMICPRPKPMRLPDQATSCPKAARP